MKSSLAYHFFLKKMLFFVCPLKESRFPQDLKNSVLGFLLDKALLFYLSHLYLL